MSDHLLHRDLTERIIGVFFDVHWDLKGGFLESVYRNAMSYALADAGLHAEREVPLEVHFRGRCVGNFRADMIVESKILLEFKASGQLDPKCDAQVINYLRATGLEVGLLLHFGQRARFKRLIVTNAR